MSEHESRKAREEQNAPGEIDPAVLDPSKGVGGYQPPADAPMGGTSTGPSDEPFEPGREGKPPEGTGPTAGD